MEENSGSGHCSTLTIRKQWELPQLCLGHHHGQQQGSIFNIELLSLEAMVIARRCTKMHKTQTRSFPN